MATIALTEDNDQATAGTGIVLIDSWAGMMPAAVLDSVIAQVKALDMEEVRREMAASAAQAASEA